MNSARRFQGQACHHNDAAFINNLGCTAGPFFPHSTALQKAGPHPCARACMCGCAWWGWYCVNTYIHPVQEARDETWCGLKSSSGWSYYREVLYQRLLWCLNCTYRIIICQQLYAWWLCAKEGAETVHSQKNSGRNQSGINNRLICLASSIPCRSYCKLSYRLLCSLLVSS